jgi:DNA primase
METEGVDFKGALELLADRYKVALELEDEDPQAAEKRQRNERFMELLERTATYYVRQLWESAEAARARDYLAARGLQEGALREFRVGYAPSAWDTVLKASLRAGFKARELHEAGLAQQSQKSGKLYDRFRSQVIFPLADPRGRVRGFAGRTLVDDAERRGPKYVNSPESDLFHKGRQLFGADIARAAAAKAGSVVVAEGYTDVIAMHQAGIRNSVAIMGTALTEDQVGELARLAPVVALALDADSAGQEAMLRASRLAAGRKLELRVVDLPRGEDPADLVQREGGEEMERRIAASVPFVRFRVLQALDGGDLSGAEGKDRVLDELRGVFAPLGPSVMRDELLRIVADRMDLSQELLSSLLARGSRAPARDAQPAAPQPGRAPTASLGPRERTERTFLALCMALPKLGAPALADLDLDADLTAPATRAAAARLREHLDAPTEGLADDDPIAALMRELSVRAGGITATPAVFRMERLQLDLHRIERDITAARSKGLPLADLAERRSTTKAEINRTMEELWQKGEPAR